MTRNYSPAIAVGIGTVAGLRSLTAPAVVSWAAREKMIRPFDSFAARMLLARSSNKIAELAVGELIADKLPITPDRISTLPLMFRVASGAACGAALSGGRDDSRAQGAFFGALGALVGTFASFYLRRRLSRSFPDFVVAFAEDAVAVTGAATVVFLASHQE